MRGDLSLAGLKYALMAIRSSPSANDILQVDKGEIQLIYGAKSIKKLSTPKKQFIVYTFFKKFKFSMVDKAITTEFRVLYGYWWDDLLLHPQAQ